jgi:hypothetical protein
MHKNTIKIKSAEGSGHSIIAVLIVNPGPKEQNR